MIILQSVTSNHNVYTTANLQYAT